MYKIIGSDQKIYGPVSAGQIRQWQAEGRVNYATLILAEGGNEWRPLAAVPEFATPPVVSLPPAHAAQNGNGMAVAGLVLGIASTLCCCFALPCAILGIIFSSIALSRQDGYPRQQGRAMAQIGLALSILGLIWHCLFPLFFAALSPSLMWHRRWHYL